MLKNLVQIDSLIVIALPGRNLIVWSSSYESLLKKYTLNRKVISEDYQVIYEIKGNEYSNFNINYSFSDEDIEEGILYDYKLQVEYLDGSIQELDQEQISSLEPEKFDTRSSHTC